MSHDNDKGGGGDAPLKAYDSMYPGLSSEEFHTLLEQHGFNELPSQSVSLWYLFFLQFTGTMPYMLEAACILALLVKDYANFGIVIGMIFLNSYVGFLEELKAKRSLDSLTAKMEQKITVCRFDTVNCFYYVNTL